MQIRHVRGGNFALKNIVTPLTGTGCNKKKINKNKNIRVTLLGAAMSISTD